MLQSRGLHFAVRSSSSATGCSATAPCRWCKNSLALDHPRVRRRIVVSREARARKTDDDIEILPAATFVKRLWAGELTA